jgi:carbamoyl-phosphate synthase large subunit
MIGTKVFVSGGAGVIGLEMVPKLVARGASVLVGDLKPRPASFDRGVRYRRGDLNTMTAGELAGFSPDVFIHLAATFERSTESYGFWEETFWHNVRLSHHLMSLAKDLPSLRRVVFASSYLIYDQDRYQFDTAQAAAVSLAEGDPIRPRNLVGMAKLAHEIELRFLDGFRAEAFSTICARIFRGYGRNSRDVISRWVRSLLNGEPITIYRPEGLFDYIYAKDTAEGLIRLAEATDLTGIVNLGTGRARRVQDVVEILKGHFPGMAAVTEAADIPFEASQADTRAFVKAIGWSPEYDLERSLPEIIAHEREKLETAKRSTAATGARETGHVLVTSAGAKAPMIRALQQAARKLDPAIQVFAGDLDPNALAAQVSDGFWAMPRTEPAQLEALIEGCRDRGVRTVIPTRDGELRFWADHAHAFRDAGVEVIVSPAASVELCLDKLAFAHFGRDHGLPFIPAAAQPEGDGPFVVKERFGAGSRAIGLRLDRQDALAHGAGLAAAIYQPMVEGPEISVDAWMDRDHAVKGLVLRRRDLVVNGESQITTSFSDAALEARMRTVLEALRLRGPVVLQAILDPHGAPRIIECNSRFGGASTTAIAAGLDLFYWTLLERHGEDLSDYPFERLTGEVRQVRTTADMHLYAAGF